MDKKFLTPEARNLIEKQENSNKTGICHVCNGRGICWENNPVGSIEQICFSCHGTGKNTILGFTQPY